MQVSDLFNNLPSLFNSTKANPSDRDLLLLTPFHLYKTYKRFPFSVLIHILLLAFISVHALFLSNEYIEFDRSNEQLFEAVFLPEEVRNEGLYDVPNTLKLIQQVVENYYAFPLVSVNRYEHVLDVYEDSYEIKPVMMRVTQYKHLSGSFWNIHCPVRVVEDAHVENDATMFLEAVVEGNQTSSSAITIEDIYDDDDDDYESFLSFGELDSSTSTTEMFETSFGFSENFDQVDQIRNSGYSLGIEPNGVYGEFDDEMSPSDLAGDFSIVDVVYDLTMDNPLGPLSLPLNQCELQHYFYEILQVALSFSYRSVNIGSVAIMPYYWDIEVLLSFQGGQVSPSITITHRQISISGVTSSDIYFGLNTVLFLISFVSLYTSIYSLIRNAKILFRTQERYRFFQDASRPSDKCPSWEAFPYIVSIRFFSFWCILNAMSCILLMASSLAGVMEQSGRNASAEFLALFGLGCMLNCIHMLRYFEYFPLLYLHVRTLRNAAVHVITYCISVMPLYWAFAVFGVLNFGPYSDKFANISKTVVTLFSLLNGDDIYDTFMEIESGQYPLVGVSRIYIFAFVTVFVTSVLNVFIFIIEDTYRQAKQSSYACEDPIQIGCELALKPESSFTSKDYLYIIFHNLDLWESRMKVDPNMKYHYYSSKFANPDDQIVPDDQDSTLADIPLVNVPTQELYSDSAPQSPASQGDHPLGDTSTRLTESAVLLLQQQLDSRVAIMEEQLSLKDKEIQLLKDQLTAQQHLLLAHST